MFSRMLAPVALAAAFAFGASAEKVDGFEQTGEALAWTVAAYASCETPETLQTDFRSEVAKLDSDTTEILAALRILADAENVCGQLSTFASEMLIIAETDVPAVEARLGVSKTPATPVFEVEQPEGAATKNSVIISSAPDLPPLSSNDPQSSDYQQ